MPVLSSDRGSLPEVVGDAGIYYDPEDIPAIGDAILQFFTDTALRDQITAAALPRAAEFTWDKAAELGEVCFRRCYEDSSGSAR